MNNRGLKHKSLTMFAASILPLLLVFSRTAADAAPDSPVENARVETSGAGLSSTVAPGDSLPIAVKLLNFGGGKKVDVTITYTISNSEGRIIYSDSETVAVETTASFVKSVVIPPDTPSGKYTASASIVYQDQVVPAHTEFSFTVERKLFGLFQRDFALYGGITIAVGLVMGILGHVLVKRYHTGRLKSLDYSDIPHHERVFYELISDTMLEMRTRVGDVALDIAADIDGLSIDKKTGRVIQISMSPSKIVALLVSGYEKALGQKVSFSFRRPEPSASKP